MITFFKRIVFIIELVYSLNCFAKPNVLPQAELDQRSFIKQLLTNLTVDYTSKTWKTSELKAISVFFDKKEKIQFCQYASHRYQSKKHESLMACLMENVMAYLLDDDAYTGSIFAEWLLEESPRDIYHQHMHIYVEPKFSFTSQWMPINYSFLKKNFFSIKINLEISPALHISLPQIPNSIKASSIIIDGFTPPTAPESSTFIVTTYHENRQTLQFKMQLYYNPMVNFGDSNISYSIVDIVTPTETYIGEEYHFFSNF